MPDRVPLASFPLDLGKPSSFAERLELYGRPAEEIEDRRSKGASAYANWLAFLGTLDPGLAPIDRATFNSSLPNRALGSLSNAAGYGDIDKLKEAGWPRTTGL